MSNPIIEQIAPNLPLYIERCQNPTPALGPINVVIMFGWTNCTLRHVSKVASYWRKKGNFHILYWISTGYPYVYFPLTATRAAAGFIPFLKEFGLITSNISDDQETIISSNPSIKQQPKLIAHALSNGGTIGMAGLVAACRNSNLPLQFSAVILDSAPGHSGVLNFHKLFTSVQTNPMKKFFTMVLVRFLVLLITPFLILYYYFTRTKSFLPFCEHALFQEEATNCPRLFVFSKTDDLVPYQEVEKYVKRSLNEGYVTKRVSFEKSDHVRHWATHTQQYEEEISEFLSENNVL
ncbi:hypothetical protein G9A89_023402 [Geosiphon pyriformis]|nr:hypothetical protein G9A89_023402 [Geosiphon pyriformis]